MTASQLTMNGDKSFEDGLKVHDMEDGNIVSKGRFP
jgi:hypothetical protein